MFIRRVLLAFFISLPCFVLGQNNDSQKIVQSAWEAWNSGKLELVEPTFLKALQADSTDTRALMGLSLYYELQEQYQASWLYFRRLLRHSPNPYPYLFANWTTPKLTSLDKKKHGIYQVWQNLLQTPDPEGILKAMAYQELGDFYKRRGDLETSQAYYLKTNTLREWTVAGPFDNISASGFSRVFAPETDYDFGKRYEGKNGVPARWHKINAIRNDGWIDFRRYYAFDNAVFYGNTFVYSPAKQRVSIRVGTSGSLKTFLNDEMILDYFDENNNDLDTYIVEATLQKGWNRLLVKCGYSEITQCNFMVRITDPKGNALSGLRYETKKQKYPQKAAADPERKPNFAERYFEEQIEAFPDHLENYVLLAQTYLRNDKAIEGELVLRKGIKRAPNNPLLYANILEAYTRGEKYDEISTTMERMYQLDKQLPLAVRYKYERYMENEQLDRAEEMLSILRQKIPGTASLAMEEIGYYSARRDVPNIIAAADSAYKHFPNNWQIAATQATISVQTTRSYGRAVEIYQEYLERQYNIGTLSTLAETYLKASAVDLWLETVNKILALEPASPGFRFQMANTLNSLQRFDEAREAIQAALDICPNSSVYWAQLGAIENSSANIPAAISAYENALLFNPANYEAREKLRELRNQPSVFTHFKAFDIAGMIANAPLREAYPNDNAVILFKNLNRVVYEQGASEMTEEILIKLFNASGIDAFKEYWIQHNGYNENLTVEESRVIKQDGSEIEADVNGNQVVFKSLEEGDFIYVKWKIKNYYSGKLSNHFWDQFYFNGYYPIDHIRYSLLVPKNFDFNYQTQHMDLQPEKRKTTDGTLYEWVLTGEPSVVYEYGMPILDDVGKVLYLSSIDDWEYMVSWYQDLAENKTRSSYEIREQVEELFSGREGLSEKEKIKTIYNYITENIRYSSVSFRQSGLIPQKARDVLVNRIGDCKDVSTLAIAMLNEVGIKAHYVLVNTRNEGYQNNALPSISFNHCIAGVETSDGIQYLDLTANNFPYGSTPPMNQSAFSLLVKPGVKAPMRLLPDWFSQRNIMREAVVRISNDNSIEVSIDNLRTGTLAAGMRSSYRDQAPEERERSLMEVLADDYLNVKLQHLDLINIDAVDEDLRYSYAFQVPDYLSMVESESEIFKFMRVPWSDNQESRQALSYENRYHPYYYWPRADTLREEIRIELPPGLQPVALGRDVTLSNDIAEYQLSFTYNKGVIYGTRLFINKKQVVQPEDYREFRAFYNRVLREDNRQILLRQIQQNP